MLFNDRATIICESIDKDKIKLKDLYTIYEGTYSFHHKRLNEVQGNWSKVFRLVKDSYDNFQLKLKKEYLPFDKKLLQAMNRGNNFFNFYNIKDKQNYSPFIIGLEPLVLVKDYYKQYDFIINKIKGCEKNINELENFFIKYKKNNSKDYQRKRELYGDLIISFYNFCTDKKQTSNYSFSTKSPLFNFYLNDFGFIDNEEMKIKKTKDVLIEDLP